MRKYIRGFITVINNLDYWLCERWVHRTEYFDTKALEAAIMDIKKVGIKP